MLRITLFLLISILLLVSHALAHNPAETHTVLEMKQGQAQLRIELPWTISEAIQKAYPKEADQEDFWTLLEVYMGENLQLSREGDLIPASSMYQLPGDHTHSAILVLNYRIKDLQGIELRNTMLFNLHQGQENHHTIVLEDTSSLSYVSTHKEETFVIGEENRGPVSFWWFAGAALLILVLIGNRIKK